MNAPPLRFISCLLLTIGITACSATGKIDCQGNFIYNPDAFSVEQQGWIWESADRWNNWVGYQVVSVRPGYSYFCQIDQGNAGEEKYIGEESHRLENIIIDFNHMRKHNIPIDRAHFEAVIMHEVGHAIGYGHIGEDGKALMAATDGALDFTDIDRAECVRRGMCKTLQPPVLVNNE